MNILDLDVNGLQKVSQQPGGIRIDQIGPAFSDWNAPLDLVNGAFRGLNNIDYTLEKNAANALRPLTAAAGLDSPWDERIKNIARIGETSKPDPLTTSKVGQLLSGIGEVLAPAVIGGALAGPAGAAAATGVTTTQVRFDENLRKGVDDNTAFAVALLEGGVNALGVALPAGVGKTLTSKIASGALMNTGIGAAQRAATGQLLDSNGYHDMAQQYRAFDKTAIATDAVLGAAFGWLAHLSVRPSPDTVDAAMAARGARHFGEDSAPGVPTDFNTSLTHQNALDLAMRQLDTGEPVDVSSVPGMSDAAFLLHNDTAVSTEMTRLRGLAGQLLSRGVRKTLAEEVHSLEYQLQRTSTELNKLIDTPLTGSGKALANARAERATTTKALNARISDLSARLSETRERLIPHQEGGLYYDAKANLSRLEQGVVPAYLRMMTRDEAGIRDADAQISSERPATASSESTAVPAPSRTADSVGGISYPPAVARLRDLVASRPDSIVLTGVDEEGAPVARKAVDVMADLDTELQTARRESTMYDAAITCFLRRG